MLDVEKLDLLHFAGGRVKFYTCYRKQLDSLQTTHILNIWPNNEDSWTFVPQK